MRACARLWLALAIALSLFAAPLRAQFAYVANFRSNNVSGYTINPSTGALTAISGSPFLRREKFINNPQSNPQNNANS